EIIVYIGQLMQSDTCLFDQMIRIRLSLLVNVLILELSFLLNVSELKIKVFIVGKKEYLKVGPHGMHIHNYPGYSERDCVEYMQHYNPYLKRHGGPNSIERHFGDMGNVHATVYNSTHNLIDSLLLDPIIKLSEINIINGLGIILHEDEDDYGLGSFQDSLTNGHAGERLACGRIRTSFNDTVSIILFTAQTVYSLILPFQKEAMCKVKNYLNNGISGVVLFHNIDNEFGHDVKIELSIMGPKRFLKLGYHGMHIHNFTSDIYINNHFIQLISDYAIVGRALVLHNEKDDYGSGPFTDSVISGHSGQNVACGFIRYNVNRDSHYQSLSYRQPLFFCHLNDHKKSSIFGQVDFNEVDSVIEIRVYIIGPNRFLRRGNHGLHIHDNPENYISNCDQIGKHFNPFHTDHGDPQDIPRHFGDLGNFSAVTFNSTHNVINEIFIDRMIKQNTYGILDGLAIVLHEDFDDYGKGSFNDSLTTGHSGKKIACGRITSTKYIQSIYGLILPLQKEANCKIKNYLNNGIYGVVLFHLIDKKFHYDVRIELSIMGPKRFLKLGYHGMHIHNFTSDTHINSCDQVTPHYNPFNTLHGGPNMQVRHIGDLGNFIAIEYNSTHNIMNSTTTDYVIQLISHYSIVGRALVLHDKKDDYGLGVFTDSSISGHSGKKLACGFISYNFYNSHAKNLKYEMMFLFLILFLFNDYNYLN
ncbi:hypothetical protein A3Q56_06580, partial [Intoshia linei]